MTSIDFYTGADDPIEVAARLVAKAWQQYGSVRVLTPDARATDALDRRLWMVPATGFYPHCRLSSPLAPDTPIVVAAQAVTVLAARTALARALGNLLQNGQRYAASRPIDLIGRLEGGALRLGVLDRGPGIPAAEIPRMLQPFQRLEPSRSAATGGSGLGLAIVARLARRHGGELVLELPPDGGLRARVRLGDAAS